MSPCHERLIAMRIVTTFLPSSLQRVWRMLIVVSCLKLREAAHHPHVRHVYRILPRDRSSLECYEERSECVLHHCQGRDRRPFRQTASRRERSLTRRLKVTSHRWSRRRNRRRCYDRSPTEGIWDTLQLSTRKIRKVFSRDARESVAETLHFSLALSYISTNVKCYSTPVISSRCCLNSIEWGIRVRKFAEDKQCVTSLVR